MCISNYNSNMNYVVRLNNSTKDYIHCNILFLRDTTIKNKSLNMSRGYDRL